MCSIGPNSAASLPPAELVVLGANEVVVAKRGQATVRPHAADLGVHSGWAVAVADGRVSWVGPEAALGKAVRTTAETRTLRADGCVVTPGLVDCHTHLVHAGDRSGEFHRRNRGETYQQIAAAGGGILSSVRSTRAAGEGELVALAAPRLRRMLRRGVTTVEIKSGYGLSLLDELKMLRAVRTLAGLQPATLVPTLLAAHSVPPEYKGRADRYLDLVVEEIIPAAASEGLADGCDVFCEAGVFDVAQARRVLVAAQAAGLRIHVHAEQFVALGGARLAAELGACSADHLEAVDAESMRALADAGVVAVGLPGCNLFLDQAARMPARELLEAGVHVALATDFNPGSCHTNNLPLVTTLGCTWLKLSAAEALAAVTCEAAAALGRAGEIGTLQVGARADLAAFAVPSYQHLPYAFGDVEARWVVVGGQQVVG